MPCFFSRLLGASMSTVHPFVERLRNAGIVESDGEELRLQKSLLFFATGLICFTSVVWLLIYWQLGPRFSSNLPFALQLLLVGNLLVYLKTLNFNCFRQIQLSLFLFTPFVAQWSIGSFITASGISLWALLAPIGAVLFIGPRESGAWFFAYVFLTLLSGGFDYYLADWCSRRAPGVAADLGLLLSPSTSPPYRPSSTCCCATRTRQNTRRSNVCRRLTGCCRANRSVPSACCSTSCRHRSRSGSRTARRRSPTASPKFR
jgi:hypothetical protein